jgi:hypothetical protein
MKIKFHLLTVCSVMPSIIHMAEPHLGYIKHITWLDWLWLGIDIECISAR